MKDLSEKLRYLLRRTDNDFKKIQGDPELEDQYINNLTHVELIDLISATLEKEENLVGNLP